MRSCLRSGLFFVVFLFGLCVSARVRNSDSLLYIFYFQIWAHSSLAHTCIRKVAIYICVVDIISMRCQMVSYLSIYIYVEDYI